VIRAVANLSLFRLPRDFLGDPHTMQIPANFLDKRRNSAKGCWSMKAPSRVKQLNAMPVRVLRPIA
jgi:hypothetical protein